jgi:hypothetical protein
MQFTRKAIFHKAHRWLHTVAFVVYGVRNTLTQHFCTSLLTNILQIMRKSSAQFDRNFGMAFSTADRAVSHKCAMAEERASVDERKKELKLSMKGLANVASLGIGDFRLRIRDEVIECSRF